MDRLIRAAAVHRGEVDLLEQARAWLAAGGQVTLATVAHTWGSSPRQPGALMVFGGPGHFAGSVSGGCIEEELITRLETTRPSAVETLEYASDSHRSLPCGGRLLLALEPLVAGAELDGLIAALRDGRRVLRQLDLVAGTARWREATPDDATTLADGRLDVVYEPAWRLVVVGAGDLATWVCRFASLLDYAIGVCDPRPEYRAAWALPEIEVSAEQPDDYLQALGVDRHTAVVALTHDPKIDDLAVLEALTTPAFYLGALGSTRTTQRRAERLAEHFGVSAEALARIRAPIGIDLNTRKPAEIALAVLADITAARNGVAVSTQRPERRVAT